MKTKPYTMLLMMLAGWLNRQQQEALEYLKEENKILRDELQKATGIVIFYTYTGLEVAGIVRNTDAFSIGSYCLTSDSNMIVESGGGYIH